MTRIAFHVVVRLAGPEPTAHELGVFRRAFPYLLTLPLPEARAHLLPQPYRGLFLYRPDGSLEYPFGSMSEAEQAARICRAGGIPAHII